jgi:hypothetical protein
MDITLDTTILEHKRHIGRGICCLFTVEEKQISGKRIVYCKRFFKVKMNSINGLLLN